MRIKMLKDYNGPLGRFAKGKCYELNPHIVKQLPGDRYKEIEANEERPRKTAGEKTGKQPPKSD